MEYSDEISETSTPSVLKKPEKRKKPSVSSSWTRSEVNDLILAVKDHQCVWEYSCPEYKDRYKRDQAWREIRDNCPEHTIEDCKAKWANIKTAFQHVKKKMKIKSSQGAENTQPHWPHWSAMQFYSRHDGTKDTGSVSTLDVEELIPYCGTQEIFDTPTTSIPKKPEKRKKPSVSSSWTHGEINDLILAVEDHPCVWEYSCPEYKDRYKRDQAWLEIQEKCPGHTIEDCKAKWANIKTAFQHVKKKMKTRSGKGAGNTQPHWPHWSAMQFYSRHDAAKSTGSESTLDIEELIPCYSTPQIFVSPEEEQHQQAHLIQRAAKFLETEEDNWDAVGTYLASQMREIAKTNKKAANKLHMQLLKTAMEAMLELEDD